MKDKKYAGKSSYCSHVEGRVDVDRMQAPDAILRLLDFSFEERLTLANDPVEE